MKKYKLFWGIYWLVVVALYIGLSIYFKSFLYFIFIFIPAFVFFLASILLFLPFARIKNMTVRRTIRIVSLLLALSGTAYLSYFLVTNGSNNLSGLYTNSLDYDVFTPNCEVTLDDETGVYTVRKKGDELRILQLTDTHICSSVTTIFSDCKAFTACYEIIRKADPDLIIVTGDIVYPIPIATFSNDNYTPFYQFCRFMENVGIPWAMVYGNHDTEALASHNAYDFQGLLKSFSPYPSTQKSSEDYSLLYSPVQPDIYGRYNNYLRIENADGTLNRLLFLIDSNDYVKGSPVINDYDSVHTDQMDWYADVIDAESKAQGFTVPSFVFMHIPFKAFSDAEAALKAGNPDAVYLFGENGEGVSYPDRDSGFFELILQKGSTQAVFVGHDHLNNMGIKYKGVDLVYSKSIDYIAYPGIAEMTAQRGGTLIVLNADGYKITQIDYSK